MAGVVRGPAAPYDVRFGPHRGTAYAECEARFSALSDEFLQYLASLDRLSQEDVAERALAVACLHHARFIEVHPFVDGNGRIGRICANYFAARYGLKPVEVYRRGGSDCEAALTVYIRQKRILPLIEYWRPFMYPSSVG